jgi:hypothetical protein
MKHCLFTAILSATSLLAVAGDPAPQMTEISQKTAKPGEVITVSGLGLTTKNVDEVYLTDHKFDMRVKVLDQQESAIQFRVPPFAKPGRVQLLFLTKGTEPKLLEQPVYLLIEDPNAEVVVAKTETDPAPVAPAVTKTEAPKSADEAKVEPKEQTKPETKVEQSKLDTSKIEHRQPK